MHRIAPVNLSNNPKNLWFDAGELDLNEGDNVVVTTARGTEFGRCVGMPFEVTDEQVEALKSPLQPVLRLATPEDEEQARRMAELSKDAMPIFRQMAAEATEEMRPISVEYLFDGDKAVFYFEAEDRIDFRDLVRNLAAQFHVRIDMRQIGVRDEARMVGGLGHCGQELCCKRLGGEFCPVSIRMAKEQDLSLNPQKISGICGRLMCCLRYEYDAYKDFNKRAPKRSATIHTPEGPAKVCDIDVPREIISVKLEGEKPVKVPLADFDPPAEEGTRPNTIGKEAWEKANEEPMSVAESASALFLTNQLTAQDKLADPTKVRRVKPQAVEDKPSAAAAPSASRKESARSAEAPLRRARRRRSTKVDASSSAPEPVQEAAKPAQEQPTRRSRRQKTTVSGRAAREEKPVQKAKEAAEQESKEQRTRQVRRRKPRAQAKPSAQPEQAKSEAPAQKAGQKTSSRNPRRKSQASAGEKPAVRPGQKSSGLRAQAGPSAGAEPKDASRDNAGAAKGRRRRRPRRSGGSSAQGSTTKE